MVGMLDGERPSACTGAVEEGRECAVVGDGWCGGGGGREEVLLIAGASGGVSERQACRLRSEQVTRRCPECQAQPGETLRPKVGKQRKGQAKQSHGAGLMVCARLASPPAEPQFSLATTKKMTYFRRT